MKELEQKIKYCVGNKHSKVMLSKDSYLIHDMNNRISFFYKKLYIRYWGVDIYKKMADTRTLELQILKELQNYEIK